jgi:hypothetical protein
MKKILENEDMNVNKLRDQLGDLMMSKQCSIFSFWFWEKLLMFGEKRRM